MNRQRERSKETGGNEKKQSKQTKDRKQPVEH